MSAKWTFWAWEQDIKTAPKKLALLQLANNANDDGKSWYSIAKMAKACGVGERTFQRQIQALEEDGLLHVERRNNRPSIYTLTDEVEIILHSYSGCQSDVAGCQSDALGGVRESHDPNSNPNSNPKRSRFTPPTEKEVFEYMQERDFSHRKESESFVNFYESKGWMVGKSKMKDWKAAVRNWISRSSLPKTVKPKTIAPPQDYDPLESLRNM